MQARVDQKLAEIEFAEQQLAQATIAALAPGIAVIDAPDDWRGRPVRVGERILSIADPERVRLQIDVSVNDAVALTTGAPVNVFLDSDPLTSIPATVKHVGFEPQQADNGTNAYRVFANFESNARHRVGLRGTARIEGEASQFIVLFTAPAH